MPGEVAALSGQWPSYLSLDYLSRATQKLDLGGGKRKKRKRGEGGRTEREERAFLPAAASKSIESQLRVRGIQRLLTHACRFRPVWVGLWEWQPAN